MKLRMQHNSIRLRLKQGEVKQVATIGRIEEKIIWGENPEFIFRYVFEAVSGLASVESSLLPDGVLVRAPMEMVRQWASSGQVGLESRQTISAHLHLHILIEKDFACLDGTDEQNADTFPHPSSVERG